MAPHRMLVVVCVLFIRSHCKCEIYSWHQFGVEHNVKFRCRYNEYLLFFCHCCFVYCNNSVVIVSSRVYSSVNNCKLISSTVECARGEKFQFTHLLQMNQVAKIHIRWTSSIIGCMLHQAQRQWMHGALEHYKLVWHVCCIVTSRENEEDWLMMEKFGLFINELLTCLHSENVLVTIWNDETIPKKLYELEF